MIITKKNTRDVDFLSDISHAPLYVTRTPAFEGCIRVKHDTGMGARSTLVWTKKIRTCDVRGGRRERGTESLLVIVGDSSLLIILSDEAATAVDITCCRVLIDSRRALGFPISYCKGPFSIALGHLSGLGLNLRPWGIV